IVAVLAPAAIVEPHCVHEAEGIPPSTPAWDQSIAREGDRIPDQFCPCMYPVEQNNVMQNTAGNKNFGMTTPVYKVTSRSSRHKGTSCISPNGHTSWLLKKALANEQLAR